MTLVHRLKKREHGLSTSKESVFFSPGNPDTAGFDLIYVRYYPNGTPWSVVYYLYGERHRTDGPAVVWYWEDGSEERREYWRQGRYISHGSERSEW